MYFGGFTAVALATAVLILAALEPTSLTARFVDHRLLSGLGRISYSLYLWHFMILSAFTQVEPAIPAAVAVGTALALSVACAAVSYAFIETPLLRWDRRRHPAPFRGGTLAVGAGSRDPGGPAAEDPGHVTEPGQVHGRGAASSAGAFVQVIGEAATRRGAPR